MNRCKRPAAARTPRWVVTTLLLLASVSWLSCSAHRRAGTGDIAFRLLWEGQSDLDLLVVDPTGQCLSYLGRFSDNGGRLDVDCNGGTGRMCEKPIENVFWPEGMAPEGTYTYWVEAHSLIPAEAPLEFELQLLDGPRVIWSRQAEMVKHQQIFGPANYAFPAKTGPEVIDSDRPTPECAVPDPTFSQGNVATDPNS